MAIFLSFAILGVTWSANEFIFKDLPDPHDLTRYAPPVTTKILDRNGQVLFRLYEDENRTIVPLSKFHQT
jgi:membrane carboxypeptidase/penicillin-binding protein